MERPLLAIESSCDETSASICLEGKILSNIIATQDVHARYGGVVPELASRAHMENIVPVVREALMAAGTSIGALGAVAYTRSPGLMGALLVGAQFAKSLSLSLQIPLIGVHHMKAHVLANLLNEPPPDFPFLCLTVSGGHTQIVLATSPYDLKILGQTIDDAAGEAFDKIAKLLELPYPGGPLIDKWAHLGNPDAFVFAKPQVPGYNYSFSGLKTSVLYFLQQQQKLDPDFIHKYRADICASVQSTIIKILLRPFKKAMLETGIKQICLAGGVSANSGLRAAFADLGKRYQVNVSVPDMVYCTDNAAMIAISGWYQWKQQLFTPLDSPCSARSEWA